jgi:hypothetical protein
MQRTAARCAAPGTPARIGRNEPNSRFGETNPTSPTRVVPAQAGTHDHRPVGMGPGSQLASRASAGTTAVGLSGEPTCGCKNDRRRRRLFPACYLQGTVQLKRVGRMSRAKSGAVDSRVSLRARGLRARRILAKRTQPAFWPNEANGDFGETNPTVFAMEPT